MKLHDIVKHLDALYPGISDALQGVSLQEETLHIQLSWPLPPVVETRELSQPVLARRVVAPPPMFEPQETEPPRTVKVIQRIGSLPMSRQDIKGMMEGEGDD